MENGGACVVFTTGGDAPQVVALITSILVLKLSANICAENGVMCDAAGSNNEFNFRQSVLCPDCHVSLQYSMQYTAARRSGVAVHVVLSSDHGPQRSV